MEERKLNVDNDGNLQQFMPAEPCKMTCEANGCTITDGHDYRRKQASKGWEDEPIFLCEKHSKGYVKI